MKERKHRVQLSIANIGKQVGFVLLLAFIGLLVAGPLAHNSPLQDKYAISLGAPGNTSAPDNDANNQHSTCENFHIPIQPIRKQDNKTSALALFSHLRDAISESGIQSSFQMYIHRCLSIKTEYFAYLNLFYLF